MGSVGGAGLDHVRWIGGGSAAGKSTVAGHLADRYGLRHYSTDEAMARHAADVNPQDAPLLTDFMAMSPDRRWVERSPEEMLETFHWFSGEAFALILEDLRALAPTPVVVEGLRLLPGLVAPVLADRGHAVWLLPTPRFRRSVFESRGGASWAFLAHTSQPERALENLLERDRLFTERLAQDTARLGLNAIRVDRAIPVAQVARLFGFQEATR